MRETTCAVCPIRGIIAWRLRETSKMAVGEDINAVLAVVVEVDLEVVEGRCIIIKNIDINQCEVVLQFFYFIIVSLFVP